MLHLPLTSSCLCAVGMQPCSGHQPLSVLPLYCLCAACRVAPRASWAALPAAPALLSAPQTPAHTWLALRRAGCTSAPQLSPSSTPRATAATWRRCTRCCTAVGCTAVGCTAVERSQWQSIQHCNASKVAVCIQGSMHARVDCTAGLLACRQHFSTTQKLAPCHVLLCLLPLTAAAAASHAGLLVSLQPLPLPHRLC